MKVNLLFFAKYREQLDCSELSIELAESSSVRDLCQQLSEKGESWQQVFWQTDSSSSMPSLQVAVNQTIANFSHELQDGDEVAFFPPVTGG
jgi:molybdopterin synthase sulfur carrier subunit